MKERRDQRRFPYFFVGTFIEAPTVNQASAAVCVKFPYFFVGTFIEAFTWGHSGWYKTGFPYFFVGTFIEAW